jgi:hypothetical protein
VNASFPTAVLMLFGAATASIATAASLVPDCDVIRSTIDERLTWKAAAPGLEYAHVDFKSAFLRDLTLVRYANDVYRARAFDMRDIVAANRSRGYYAPPLYSIGELLRNLRQAALVASAGLTRSYSEPVPAGFLRVDGTTRSPVAPNDKIIDGVACFAQDGRVSILSDMGSGVRRAPKDVRSCHSGFQAGPVLVANGVPTSTEHKLIVARVFLGLPSGDSTIIGFSTQSSTAALGCAAASRKVGIVDAIGMQGDSLGGAGLGTSLASVAAQPQLGNTDATIASALIVEPRATRKATSR